MIFLFEMLKPFSTLLSSCRRIVAWVHKDVQHAMSLSERSNSCFDGVKKKEATLPMFDYVFQRTKISVVRRLTFIVLYRL